MADRHEHGSELVAVTGLRPDLAPDDDAPDDPNEVPDALTVAIRLALGGAAMVVDQVAKTVAPGGPEPDQERESGPPPRAIALAVGAIVEGLSLIHIWSAHGAERRADLVDEHLGLLERREVAALRELAEPPEVGEPALGPPP